MFYMRLLRAIEQKLKLVRKFCCSLATTQRAQVFRSCKFGFSLLAEVQQHIKKSELHDLLQGRTLFYVYIDWTNSFTDALDHQDHYLILL
jgi:hypothetical protein